MILSQFQTVGRDLFTKGLVSSHSGNLSIRLGERIFITRRGSRLGCLEEHDLIETGLSKNDRNTPLASVELAVHRAIYRETPALAIVHAHPPHAVALSLTETEIVPIDTDGQSIMEKVPVLGWGMKVKPGALGDEIAQALKQSRVVLVHGHGTFAIGQLMEEAHNYTTTLEESCQVICLLKSLRGEVASKRGVSKQ
ncbi:MAG: aldolase [Dehalococcoidales bacterium]|nr:aldolase [Dehalococcoidales bacterium]